MHKPWTRNREEQLFHHSSCAYSQQQQDPSMVGAGHHEVEHMHRTGPNQTCRRADLK